VRDADPVEEAALQGAAGSGVTGRQGLVGLDGLHPGADQRVEGPVPGPALAFQPVQHQPRLPVRIAGGRFEARQPGGHVQPLIGRGAQGVAQPVARAIGLKAQGHHLDGSGGADGDGPGHLSGEQRGRLEAEGAVDVGLLIGIAEVEDQFGTAVRRDPLDRPAGAGTGVGPDLAHPGAERLGRIDLVVSLPRVHAQCAFDGSGGAAGSGAQGMPSSLRALTSFGVASP